MSTAPQTNGTIKIGIGPKKIVTGKKLPAPKKPEAKAPEPKKAASKRTAYDDAAEIVVLVKDNPRREGSELYKDFERMRKCKTVADYYKSGGRTSVLGKCIAKKWIKLT